MKHKYIYPNYCTRYTATVNGCKYYGNNFGISACYGQSLAPMSFHNSNSAHYQIVLMKDFSLVDCSYNNFCWMTKHQLEKYLRRIASLKPFKYKVFEDTIENKPCLKIDLNIVGTKKEITFVLQNIKRCYEFPFNFYLLQAFKMQELPAFKFDSILNLFDVAFSTFDSMKNYDHCYSGCTKFEKYATIREKLPHISHCVDLFPTEANTKIAPKVGKITRGDYKGTAPCVIDEWGDCFEVFLPYYIENYKILKK